MLLKTHADHFSGISGVHCGPFQRSVCRVGCRRDVADRTASAEMVLNTEAMGITAEMVLNASAAYLVAAEMVLIMSPPLSD